ncbi:4003_t:CDS:2, partial [Cetraspora pellucida]
IESGSDYLFQQESRKKYLQPEPFLRLTISDKPKNYPENQLEIVLNFCLTIDSEPNLSLFRDFEEIIEEYSQIGNVVTYPQTSKDDSLPKPLYAPFASDPSQNYILKVIFHHFAESALCVDGPPGTGKSQLICNLLANSLAYQKKVLVVCEKEVALKVIYDQLNKIGLNHSLIKISKLDQTPQIYQTILSSLKTVTEPRTNRHIYFDSEKKITELEEKQTHNLQKIANYCWVENGFQTSRQIPLSVVYLKFTGQYQLSPTLLYLNKRVKNKEQLDKLKNNLEVYIKNKNNFQEIISNLLRELKGEKVKTNLLSRILQTKLVQEYSKNHQSIKLLENKIKDLEGLQHKYQGFFSFLQIENFGDFWQKCSNEKFLITIRQFISEEFLTIGELNFVLASFDDDTKKNVDYFLTKILINQEFNYLNNHTKSCEQASELIRIQQEQQEIAEKKRNLVKEILKNNQKKNLKKLSTNHLLIRELSKKRKIPALKKIFPELLRRFPWRKVFLYELEPENVLLLEEKSINGGRKNINLELDDLEKNSSLLTYAKKYARNREKLTLLYHYRSKYPELIEFSNQAFYDGILQIVSASELRKNVDLPVEYHYQADGQIGIITFNAKQQDKISEYIDEKVRYKNLFIKNLEEVQGDERDIIIFSIGYGPDKEGKIKLNFGPLSREGGEKRLNVAISRAREKIIVVTSLLPNDLNRIVEEDENRQLGPKLFKKYLEYAYYCSQQQFEKSQEILEKTLPKIVNTFSAGEESARQTEFGSSFEEHVYNELTKQISGYEIHRQVKSVGYHIDLAIWDSQVQQYILGIECDGEYWHSKLENIERDIYRQYLLESKG